MKYSYQSEKLSIARKHLMLPHYGSEANSIACAFQELHLAFRDLNVNKLNHDAQGLISKLKELMEENDGSWLARAQSFSTENKQDFSEAVNDLANWFNSSD